MELLNILEDVFNQKGHKTSNDYYSFNCPFCNHYKPKLNVNIKSQHWHCWVCPSRGKSVYQLFKQMNAPKTFLEKVQTFKKQTFEKTHDDTITLQYPKSYELSGDTLIDNLVRKYTEKRSLTPNDLKKHNIRYVLDGRFSNMLILPSYTPNGQLQFYIGRSFQEKQYNHLTPDASKNFIGFEHTIDWEQDITLVEAPLDAITVRRNAIPLHGKKIPEKLKIKLIEENVPRINICLDGDAFNSGLELYEYLLNHGKNVYFVELFDNEDPNNLGYDEIWNRINNARKITHDELFKIKMKMKLYGK